jgi:hypothetical protein
MVRPYLKHAHSLIHTGTTRILALFLILALSALACNLPGSELTSGLETETSTPADTATTPPDSGTSGPEGGTPTDTPVATDVTGQTPLPTATSSQPCNLASFVSDVTIPDGTQIELNQAFSKTWRLKNAGTCTWTSGYSLVFESGDQMGGPASQTLTNGSVAPGGNLDITVNLAAPGGAGTYRGNWKIREPGGAVFGLSNGPFWVEIKAVAQGAPPPPALPAWPVYKQGNQGPEVKAIQYLLRFHGQNPTPDGIFGPATKTAVQAFQNGEGLNPDGIVGSKTWGALISGAQISSGSSGQAVRAAQSLLADKYGYGIAVDGAFGPATRNAVKDFQSGNGLDSDGIVGPQTWQALVGY